MDAPDPNRDSFMSVYPPLPGPNIFENLRAPSKGEVESWKSGGLDVLMAHENGAKYFYNYCAGVPQNYREVGFLIECRDLRVSHVTSDTLRARIIAIKEKYLSPHKEFVHQMTTAQAIEQINAGADTMTVFALLEERTFKKLEDTYKMFISSEEYKKLLTSAAVPIGNPNQQ